MTYSNKFAVAVKTNGKIMREYGTEVFIPFGTEYSLLLKNLNSRKAVTQISIDGKDIGHRVIINANDSVEIERFIDELDKGYKFRFIEKTKEISDYRGDKIDDGIIRIEYWFEKEIINQPVINPYPVYPVPYISPSPWIIPINPNPWNQPYGTWCDNGGMAVGSSDGSTNVRSLNMNYKGVPSDSSYYSQPISSTTNLNNPLISKETQDYCDMLDRFENKPTSKRIVMKDKVLNDNGITVNGNDSNQKFTYGYTNELEEHSSVITLQLKGQTESNKVEKPIAVNTRIRCTSCGKNGRSGQRFCDKCGTRLV